MKKRILAILLSLALVCTAGFAGLSVLAEDPVPLEVTGVGIFDQTPNKGIHTFNENAKLIQVTFNRDFWTGEASYVELNEAVNLYLKINGKTPSQWVGDYGSATWGCITAHVKRSDALGQYLEINLTGVEGLPSESTDSTIEFLPGFAGGLGRRYTFHYTANQNVPYAEEALEVTGVGIFDQTPNKGIHTFNENAKLIQVKFNRDFWPQETNFVELNEAVNLYLKINGKTPSEWVGEYGSATWGCITAHVKRSDALGQYLEINLTGVEGLPSESIDSTIEFLPGFAGVLDEAVVYAYKAGQNLPYTIKTDDGGDDGDDGDDEENPAEGLVTGVGVFDQEPNKGIHDFGTARLIQVKFGEDFYDPAQLTGGVKQWVQGELGDYIKINGKTVSEWNGIEFNSVQIHVKTSEALGGQYLEINTSALEGLPLVTTDNTVEFLPGFPVFGKAASDKAYAFTYKANENVPFVLEENSAPDEGGEGGDDGKPEEKPQPDGLVTGVGIFDQTPNKGIHTFNENAKLIQVKFSEAFYDPAQLTGGVKQWVQSELGDYIKINGKTVSAWNEIEFNSAQVHVKTNQALGGQYLEINLSGLKGLPAEDTDNTVEILKGFPVFGKAASDRTYTFTYKAGQNVPFTLTKTENPETGAALPVVPFALAAAAGLLTAGTMRLRKKRAA